MVNRDGVTQGRRRGTVRGTGRLIIRARRVLSVRFPVLSVPPVRAQPGRVPLGIHRWARSGPVGISVPRDREASFQPQTLGSTTGLMKARPPGTAAAGPDRAQPGYVKVMCALHAPPRLLLRPLMWVSAVAVVCAWEDT
jgi:hypothetical protein